MQLSVGPTADPRDYRDGSLRPCNLHLRVGTWNVEGLTEAKHVELEMHMRNLSIDILCLQEIHNTGSEYYSTKSGFLFILSGKVDADDNETAGVGFVVAPHLRRSVISFRQETSRMACLKLRVVGGKAAICSTYAPHSGKPAADRQHFYSELGGFLGKISRHGPLLVLGDFNARLHRRFPNEEQIIGPYMFGSPGAAYNAASNRSLLAELCTKAKLSIGNTFFDMPADHQVTCYDIGKSPGDPVTPDSFGQIDFVDVSSLVTSAAMCS